VSQYARKGDWTCDAACAGKFGVMHVARERDQTKAEHEAAVAYARRICDRCPVRAECLQWALTKPDPCEWSMAGGKTPEERQELRGDYAVVLARRARDASRARRWREKRALEVAS
jgi:WhiB family redox-sensing transcriptional regulator